MDMNEYFESLYAGTKNPSLEAMEYFMEEFGNPHQKLKVIHVAGTNGKGSITEMLSNILIEAGYQTGKYMSPHLVRYHERFCINNQPISDKEMERLFLELVPKVEKYNQNHASEVTLFEFQTTMALLYFARNHCDFVILETGLGGLFDCTNVVTSSISIISSIGYDHREILGNTLSQIATQKAGIIKERQDTVFVSQEKEVNEIIEKTCQEKRNTLHKINPENVKDVVYQEEFTKFSYQNYKEMEISLKGEKQPENAAVCLECVEILRKRGHLISDRAVREGLKTVLHKGRYETICHNPLMIFDGAHNKPAIQHLRNTIQLYHKNAKKVFIISILRKKDYCEILKQMLSEDGVFIFTSGNEQGDYVTKEELLEIAEKIAPKKELYQKELKEAIHFAQNKDREAVIFIIGSFYVYGTVIQELEEEKNDTN